jgi:hypothetical protein
MKITRTLFVLLCLVAFSTPAEAGERHLTSYQEKIRIHQNGSAQVETIVVLGELKDKILLLPLNYLWVEKIVARVRETGETLPAAIENVDGIDYLRVQLSATALPGHTILISFRDPAYLLWKNAGPRAHDLYRWKSEFQNTSPYIIDTYEMDVILPEGFAIHQIQKSTPEVRKNEPEPPYLFSHDPEGDHIRIRTRDITLGKRCMIEYTFAQNKRSMGLLIGGIAAILALLYFFKETFKEKSDGS